MFDQCKHSPTQFTPEWTFDTYEELWWQYLEAIKEERRRLLAKVGVKNPDHQEWQRIMTTPVGPNLDSLFAVPSAAKYAVRPTHRAR